MKADIKRKLKSADGCGWLILRKYQFGHQLMLEAGPELQRAVGFDDILGYHLHNY